MVETATEQKTGAETVVWDLSVLYSGVDDAAIQADMDAIAADVQAYVAQYRGRVAELTADELFAAIAAVEALYDRLGRIGAFAQLLFSEDTNNPQYGALVQKVTEYYAHISQQLLFFELEWNEVDDAVAEQLLDDPALSKYRHYLEAERRYKPYQLSEAEEKLLVEKAVTGRNAWTRFFTQLMGAARYEYEGESLTQSEILAKLYDPDRDVRRTASQVFTDGLRKQMMGVTYIFNVLAADKASDDRLRGYPSWVSSRNLSNKVDDAVVEALIESVTSNYDIVARHYHLKRALLGYDELTEYDRYAPLPVKDSDRTYSWDEAREIVQNAYRAFSPQMADIAQRFFDENWIHAALRPGKRGGAFSAGTVPSAHPFILLNYTGQARDVMTLAHELGHGVHQYLAAQAQGLINSSTPLTTAEMASTFGEMLVFSDMMQKEPDAEARLSMLVHKVEDTFATVFRQVSMNRFEDLLHTARREEGELTDERINALWMQSQRAMFGDSVKLGENYGLWWSYVPHFLHTPGYVYAYAFGELLVLALFNIYKERGADFVPQYLAVLEAGGSDWPHRILEKVGVDLTDHEFWKAGLDAIRDLVAQEEALARDVYPDKFA
ncbi:MAG: M3 family oligoendopeptidase [Chloroflexi bacterium]|nr:MAG: M3 family oligoendopeptidase [Chloroflexota bacterium]